MLGQALLLGFRDRAAAAAAARAALSADSTNQPATDLTGWLKCGHRTGVVLLVCQCTAALALILGVLVVVLAGEPGTTALGAAAGVTGTAAVVLGLAGRRLTRRNIALFPGIRLVAAALLGGGALTGAALAMSGVRLLTTVTTAAASCAMLLLFVWACWRRATRPMI